MLNTLSMLIFSIFLFAQNVFLCPQMVETVPQYELGEDANLLPRCMRIMHDDVLNVCDRARTIVRINTCEYGATVKYRSDYAWTQDKYRPCVVIIKNTQYPAYQLKTAKGFVVCDIFTKSYVSKIIRGLEQREFYDTLGQTLRPRIEFRGREKSHEIVLHHDEGEYVFLQGGERSCFNLIHQIYSIKMPRCCGFRFNVFFDENSAPLLAVFSRNMLFEENICSPIVEFRNYAGVVKYFCGFLTLCEAWYAKSTFTARSRGEGNMHIFAYRSSCGLRDRWEVRAESEKPRSEVSRSEISDSGTFRV